MNRPTDLVSLVPSDRLVGSYKPSHYCIVIPARKITPTLPPVLWVDTKLLQWHLARVWGMNSNTRKVICQSISSIAEMRENGGCPQKHYWNYTFRNVGKPPFARQEICYNLIALPLEYLKTLRKGKEYSFISRMPNWLETSCIPSKNFFTTHFSNRLPVWLFATISDEQYALIFCF